MANPIDPYQKRKENKVLLIKKIKGIMGNQDEMLLTTMTSIDKTIAEKKDLKEEWLKAHYKICCKIRCFCCCCKISKVENEKLKKQEKEIEAYNEFISPDKKEKQLLKCNVEFSVLCFFAFFHFIAISQINSISYSLFGEVKRSLLKHLSNKIDWFEPRLTNK